jgi:hypothetical protein
MVSTQTFSDRMRAIAGTLSHQYKLSYVLPDGVKTNDRPQITTTAWGEAGREAHWTRGPGTDSLASWRASAYGRQRTFACFSTGQTAGLASRAQILLPLLAL